MSGHGADVKNSIWMRAVLFAGGFLTFGIIAFSILGIALAGPAHEEYLSAVDEYHHAEDDYHEAIVTGHSIEGDHDDPLYIAKEDAHHHEVEAHLSYLNWKVSGNTILVMSIIFASFIGIGGLINSLQPDAEHSDDEHEHHGSASPIIFSFGIMLFMIGFPGFANTVTELLTGTNAVLGEMAIGMIGLLVIIIGIGNWWREDLPFNGHGEQIATSDPFAGEHIRKAGIWVFIMSEIMIFATFFSSYLRMRTGWCTKWAYDNGNCAADATGHDILTASDYLRPGGAVGTGDFWTMLPGGINTFALIISSYTIVIALKTAKAHDWSRPDNFMTKFIPEPVMKFVFPDQKRTVRNFLFATLLLGSLFIILKLVEWSHLVAEGFTVSTSQAGSIFYIATGAHGLHVFIGLLIMLYLVFKADTVGYDEENAQGIEYFGLYWHFVDLAWVIIFPAFYLY
jgi:cytochrome c oxidase subunit I+III